MNNNYALAAFNIYKIAKELSADSSNFGRLCVAELNDILDGLLEKMGAVDTAMTIKMFDALMQATKEVKDKDKKADVVENLLDAIMIPENQWVLIKNRNFLQHVITFLDAIAGAYGPNHPLHSKYKEALDKLAQIIHQY